MVTPPSVTEAPHPGPPDQPSRTGPILRALSLRTTRGRRRVLGAALLVLLFAVFTAQDRLPALDAVREDFVTEMEAAGRAAEDLPALEANGCFQGFCIETEDPLVERWWNASLVYFELIAAGVLAALLLGGLAAGLVFDDAGRRTARRRIGADRVARGVDGVTLVLVFALFTPVFAASRAALGIAAVMVLGPAVARLAVSGIGDDAGGERRTIPDPAPDSWPVVMRAALSDWGRATVRLFVRLAPALAAAGLGAALVMQFLSIETMTDVFGNHLAGVALAAGLGVLLIVPARLEIALVAGFLVLGMGSAPAIALVFTAAVIDPLSIRRLGGSLGRRAAAALAGGTWAIGALGGVALLVLGLTPNVEQQPVVAFDGTTCSYEGPETLDLEPTRFAIRNDTADEGNDFTLAIVVGRVPDEIGYDRFSADVRDAPRDMQPAYFRIAGEHDFVFPGTTEYETIVLHTPGTYAAVCLYGGGPYLVTEFSMPQPPEWFDEFRDQFTNYVSRPFAVAG